MALDDDIRVLAGVGLFRGLAEEHLRLLAFGAEKHVFEAGDPIFAEGEAANTALVVLSGRVDLLRKDAHKVRTLGVLGPGTIVGELALITPTQRQSDAVAGARTQLMSIERRNFRRVLEEYPGVARRLQQQLIEDFQAMVRQAERLAGPQEE